jgi:hypothetical protein
VGKIAGTVFPRGQRRVGDFAHTVSSTNAPLPTLHFCLTRYGPAVKAQSAPPRAFCFTRLGSIVHDRAVRLSNIDPAAPSDGTPDSIRVA